MAVINTVTFIEVTPAYTVEMGHIFPKESLKADVKPHLVLSSGRGYQKSHWSGFREERLNSTYTTFPLYRDSRFWTKFLLMIWRQHFPFALIKYLKQNL